MGFRLISLGVNDVDDDDVMMLTLLLLTIN